MSFLQWRKRKKPCNFSCMAAIIADEAGAALDFDLIEARRLELGLSRQALADLTEVDQSTIWRYRKKGMVPNLAVATKFAEVLGLSMDEITGKAGNGNPTPPPPTGPSTPKPPAGPRPNAAGE